MMVERLFSLPSYKKSARQQCSVPFLWEEKPGTPKKNWRPEGVLVRRVGPPLKLITMVPFKWEEKPGTPLPGLSCPQEKPVLMIEDSPALPLPPAKLVVFPPSSGSSRWSSPGKVRGKLRNMFSRMMNHDGGDTNKDNVMKDEEEDRASEAESECEEEKFDLDIDETVLSFGSAKCLLANCCASKELISNAIPVGQLTLGEESVDAQDEIPSPASETESYFSSSVYGSSRTGSSFIECLFPPYSPDSEYLDEVDSHDDSRSPTFPDPREANIARKTPTLGELIRVSCGGRRRSSLHVKKRNPSSLEFMKGFGCCVARTENNAEVTHAA